MELFVCLLHSYTSTSIGVRMCWHLGNVALEARVVERKNFPKHGIASKVISLGGIAPQNPLSLHTMGGHFYYI